jgi:RimJ/RimL family protein N-acetyltransferase
LGSADPGVLRTPRLELVPATPTLLIAALKHPRQFGSRLHALVPPNWPPEYLDAPALKYTLARLRERPEHQLWWLYFVLCPGGPASRILIGSAGFKGPPDQSGIVEIGYGIVSDQRRRGYASEAAEGLVGRAFADPRVSRVIAETLPELVGSIGVMTKCGFEHDGAGSEPGVIRYGIDRDAWLARSS